MTPLSVTPRPLWWLDAGVRSYLGFRPGLNRSTLYAVSGVIAGVLFIAAFFRLAGITASRPTGHLANIAVLLGVCQVLCLAATRPVWRDELFQDPAGPLLPYTVPLRVVLWTTLIVTPIALGLGAAYAGVHAGLPGLPARVVLAAWLVDVVSLSTLALGMDLWRWLFRTYAPLPLQRLWALVVITVFNIVAVAVGVLCLVVALQFAVHRVFVSQSVTALLRNASVGVATLPEAAPIRDALSENRTRFQSLETVSAMSALVTEGRHPSPRATLQRGAALVAVLLLIGVFPGRRPEEQDRVTRFASGAREWATSLTVRVWPSRFRVAWRLMLSPLYVATRYAAVGAFILAVASFFLVVADVWGAAAPRRIERVMATYGGVLVTLLALAHTPIANGLGVRASDYVRYATLPLPTHQLLRRMLLVGVLGGALLDALLAITWGLVVQRDLITAVLFSAGVVFLLVAALCGYIALIATYWSQWLRLAPIAAGAWAIVPAAILIWQFQMLRKSPEMLPSAAAMEALASILAAGAAWVAIGRMVARREPTASI